MDNIWWLVILILFFSQCAHSSRSNKITSYSNANEVTVWKKTHRAPVSLLLKCILQSVSRRMQWSGPGCKNSNTVGRNQSLACLDPPSPTSLRNCGARSDKPLICWLRECRRALLRWWQAVCAGEERAFADLIVLCQVGMSTSQYPHPWAKADPFTGNAGASIPQNKGSYSLSTRCCAHWLWP